MKLLTSITALLSQSFVLLALSSCTPAATTSEAPPQNPPSGGEATKTAPETPMTVNDDKSLHGKIVDTHVHLYQVTRPGGVVWPEPKQKPIYRDILPADYKKIALENGIVGTGIVEASPDIEDNFKVLDSIKGDDFFRFLVAQAELGSPHFSADLARLAKDRRVVGIRGFLWSPKLTLDAKQLASVKELAAQGMTLDIISRGTLNPKDKVDELATKVPTLRIIIDHLAGAKGETPDPVWVAAIQKLAAHPNIYIKFSSFFDMFNPTSSEDEAWKSPSDVKSYKPHFDVLMKAFGEDRLIWGSNWPVVDLGGDIHKEIEIAEEYLRPYGEEARDKVMYKNAEKFYARQLPSSSAK